MSVLKAMKTCLPFDCSLPLLAVSSMGLSTLAYVSVNFKCKTIAAHFKGLDFYTTVKRYHINLYDLTKDGTAKETRWHYSAADKGNVWLMPDSCMKIEYGTHIGRGIQLTDADLIINMVKEKGNMTIHKPIQATDIACRRFESSSVND